MFEFLVLITMVDLIVKSKIKEYARSKEGVAVAEDFYSELEVAVKSLVDKAIIRAKGNKRNTLQPKDV